MNSKAILELFNDADVEGLVQVEHDKTYSEAEIFHLLKHQVSFLLDNRRDWLLGKLYRLDVRERDILAALEVPGSDPASELTRLIIERQQERAEAKRKFKSPPLSPEEEDLRW